MTTTIYFVMPAESETVKQGEQPLQELLQKFCVCLIVVGGVDCCLSITTFCCLMSVKLLLTSAIRSSATENPIISLITAIFTYEPFAYFPSH